MAPLRGNLVQVLDILESSKPILLTRFREAEAERVRLESRQKEMLAARRREEEARKLAERAAMLRATAGIISATCAPTSCWCSRAMTPLHRNR